MNRSFDCKDEELPVVCGFEPLLNASDGGRKMQKNTP